MTTPTWTNITATAGTAPPPRTSGGLVYDAEDGYTILFGGEYLNATLGRFQAYNDTWEFSGGQWTNVTGALAPSPRFGFGLAFDSLDAEVVLFGGETVTGHLLNDTWRFSGGHWANITTASAPPARFWPSMSGASASYGLLLFGGLGSASTELNDTWEFTGGTWTQLSPTNAPSARHGAGMVSDDTAGAVVLYGGLGTSLYLNDTWEFAAGDWTEVAGVTGPDARAGAGFAYDSEIQAGVLYGGYPANDYPYGTWLWNGTDWTVYNLLPNTPPTATVWNQFTYDGADQWVVYFVPNSGSTYVFNESLSGSLEVQAAIGPTRGVAPLTVSLNSSALGGTPPYNTTWRLNGTPIAYTSTASTVLANPGQYEVNLTVSDSADSVRYFEWTVQVLPALSTLVRESVNPSVVGEVVNFTSLPSGGLPPYVYSWNLGDGTTATSQNVSHAFSSAASFPVKYYVQDEQESRVYVNVTQVVMNASVLVVSASVVPLHGTAPVDVVASSIVTGGIPPYRFQWEWGDGSGDAFTQNATHVYTRAGSFAVNFTGADTARYLNESWTVTVAAPLTLSIAATPDQVRVGENVSFSSTPGGGATPYAYLWHFADGTTSTLASPIHAYSSPGTFVASLTVTDQNGATITRNVSVGVQGSSSSGSASFWSTYWWIWVVVGLILLIFFLILLAGRRRRKRPPANELRSTPSLSGSPPPTANPPPN